MGKTQPCAVSTVAWFFCEKRVPQTATRVEHVSEWITMWRGFNVDTRRRIRKVWGKRPPLWQNTTVGGIKRQVQSLPPFALCWRRAGIRAHQVSGKRQKPVLLWIELCSTSRRSSTVPPRLWKCKCGKERLGIRSVRAWRKVAPPTLPRRPGLN